MLSSSCNRIHYPHISRAVLVWAIGQDVGMASLHVAWTHHNVLHRESTSVTCYRLLADKQNTSDPQLYN